MQYKSIVFAKRDFKGDIGLEIYEELLTIAGLPSTADEVSIVIAQDVTKEYNK